MWYRVSTVAIGRADDGSYRRAATFAGTRVLGLVPLDEPEWDRTAWVYVSCEGAQFWLPSAVLREECHGEEVDSWLDGWGVPE